MSGRRCPSCRALNDPQAGRCSLCGEDLVPQEEDHPRDGPAGPAAPSQSHTPAARLAPHLSLWARGAGVGALAGGVLALLVVGAFYLVADLHLPLIGGLVNILFALFLPPALGLGGLPLAAGSVLTGVLAGALLGVLAVFLHTERSPWPPAGFMALLFMALAGGGSWGSPVVVVNTLRAAVCGLVYGYVIWLIVCGYLAAARTPRTE